MKKYIITVIFAIGFGMSLNAQTDGYFTSSYSEFRNATTPENENWGVMPGLFNHGAENHQPAPLGSGLLLLAGMGAAYALKRKKDNE